MDSSIIDAVTAAVEKDPGNDALRLHLATLLLSGNRAADALQHCVIVLGTRPDHLDALDLAARSAEATGNADRAESYRRLWNALMGSSARNLVESAFGDTPPADPFAESPDEPSERVGVRAGPLDDEPDLRFEPERPTISLADVAGMAEVKRRLNLAFLGPMRNPELRKLYGKSLRGGLLLYGPPGCGKTHIARALAGELGAGFLAVGLADVLDMWLGQSERNLHEIFETARRSRPCVLFFDEIDALGRKRSLMRQSAGRDVVNQLLAELDSVASDNEGVFVLAATNHPWDVDLALRRPGRLDRSLLVLPPDQPAREAILKMNLRDRPVGTLDLKGLASRMEGFSGADAAHVCEGAAEIALEDSISSGKVRPITGDDFKRALKEVRPTTRAWFDTARNYALFANEGGMYDDLLDYLRIQKMT